MKAVAKIESDFNPRDRIGSYIGLFKDRDRAVLVQARKALTDHIFGLIAAGERTSSGSSSPD
jgi:hypothetical protein